MSSDVQNLGAELIGVLEKAAVEAAGGAVSLVSVTLDATGEIGGAPLSFQTAVDRKTRTLVFLNARALDGGVPVMTGTAVYSILGD